jgi:hypothetical protein
MTTLCDNIGSTGDGMLPMSFQEQATSMSYPTDMGSFIQKKRKTNSDIYNGWDNHSWLKKNTSSESAH